MPLCQLHAHYSSCAHPIPLLFASSAYYAFGSPANDENYGRDTEPPCRLALARGGSGPTQPPFHALFMRMKTAGSVHICFLL